MSTESIGSMSIENAICEYEALGVPERSAELKELLSADVADRKNMLLERAGNLKPWEYTGVGVGYIEERSDGQRPGISSAGPMAADATLKNARVNIKLDGFVVADYPFRGTSQVLLEVSGRHHVQEAKQEEPVSFTRKFPVRDQGAAAIVGLPLFNGLMVPPAGIGIEFRVVFVKNEKAHGYLDFLNSAPMTSGLSLVTTANPAIAPFTEIVKGLVSYVTKRHDGAVIHTGYIGLDFTGTVGAKIRSGTYVIAQIPGLDIDWSKWTISNGEISSADAKTPFPFNYYLIRVEKTEAASP